MEYLTVINIHEEYTHDENNQKLFLRWLMVLVSVLLMAYALKQSKVIYMANDIKFNIHM